MNFFCNKQEITAYILVVRQMKAIYISNESLSARKVKKIIKKQGKDACFFVLTKNVKQNKKIIKVINKLELPICDGRWLFKYLVVQVLEYIEKQQKKKMEEQNLAFMIDSYNEIVEFYIKYLTNKVKSLKIITEKRNKFKQIENEMFQNDGTVLTISNNKRKALKNIDIIINFEYSEEKINKFAIKDNAIIINLKEKITIISKRYRGININSYDICFSNRYLEMLEWIKKFENKEIYESYIYGKQNIYNIEKQMIKDNVEITELIGNRGKISKEEYQNILDKSIYLT